MNALAETDTTGVRADGDTKPEENGCEEQRGQTRSS
jgi:hypothetical protein